MIHERRRRRRKNLLSCFDTTVRLPYPVDLPFNLNKSCQTLLVFAVKIHISPAPALKIIASRLWLSSGMQTVCWVNINSVLVATATALHPGVRWRGGKARFFFCCVYYLRWSKTSILYVNCVGFATITLSWGVLPVLEQRTFKGSGFFSLSSESVLSIVKDKSVHSEALTWTRLRYKKRKCPE